MPKKFEAHGRVFERFDENDAITFIGTLIHGRNSVEKKNARF